MKCSDKTEVPVGHIFVTEILKFWLVLQQPCCIRQPEQFLLQQSLLSCVTCGEPN